MSFRLVDTNVIINTSLLVALMSEGPVKASIITRAELEFGVATASTSQERATREARLNALDHPQLAFWLPFDSACSTSYGLLSAHARAMAPAKARSQDALIAATAHAHNTAIYTNNVRDFRVFEPLIVVTKPDDRVSP